MDSRYNPPRDLNMSPLDTTNDVAPNKREAPRDKLLLSATCHWPARNANEKVKVRNVSATGLMAEGMSGAMVGENVIIDLRNIGPVEGMVVWVAGNRFGVALAHNIDPVLLRSPAEGITSCTVTRDYYQRGPVSVLNRQNETRYDRLRRI